MLKAPSLKLAMALKAHFLKWRLTCFGKELLKYYVTLQFIHMQNTLPQQLGMYTYMPAYIYIYSLEHLILAQCTVE